MTPDGFWELFSDTGDPFCWLMSRAEQRERRGAPALPETAGTEGTDVCAAEPP